MTYLQNKKLAFMSMVNSVKGFVRSVLGIPPLTLPDCVDEDSLINYTISGNSVQNGTPTPENPVEVESVGELTKNMFEIRTPDLKGQPAYNGYGGTNHTVYDYGIRITEYAGIGFWFNDLEVGATYTLSCKFLTSGTSGVIFVIGQNQGQSATSTVKKQAWNNQLKEGQRVALTFTADETNLLSFGLGNSVAIEIGEIQLEKGSARTDYEPYGYKIPVVCSGKNLLNPEHFKYRSINVSNVWNNTYGLWVFAKANKTYKFSISKLVNCTSYRICFALYDSNKNLINNTTGDVAYDLDKYTTMSCNYYTGWYHGVAHTYIPNNNMTNTDNIVITFTPKQDLYISWYLSYGNVTANTYAEEPQIEESSTVTDYEPYVESVTTNIYLDEPLAEGETLTNPVKLPTFKGTTIISVDTKVQPSHMELTYYATSKE